MVESIIIKNEVPNEYCQICGSPVREVKRWIGGYHSADGTPIWCRLVQCPNKSSNSIFETLLFSKPNAFLFNRFHYNEQQTLINDEWLHGDIED